MYLPLFIAKRIYGTKESVRKVSSPAIHIATLGVAVGIAVMIITVSVVVGFKKSIRDKLVGFGSHIQIINTLAVAPTDNHPISVDDSLWNVLNGIEGVAQAERYAVTHGVLKTDGDFLGVTFKGIGQGYDCTFLRNSIVTGDMPAFSDSVSSNQLLISKTVADKLALSVGDKVYAYFIMDDVRARRFTVSGVYQTNMAQIDDAICITDINTVVKLNKWSFPQCSGVEVIVNDFAQLDQVYEEISAQTEGLTDKYGNTFFVQTIQSAYPGVFSWLDLLNTNVWIILALMVCVAGFTMISGLLIIITERARMIGIMKALGAKSILIREVFIWFATFIIGRGLFWGNILGLGVVILQKTTGFFSLDPQIYYVNTAPVELNWWYVALLNIATLVACIVVLIAPSYLITHIRPAKTMQYD